MTDGDDLQQAYVAAREQLAAARARLDEFGLPATPIDEVPETPAATSDPVYREALAAYEQANAEFVRIEAELRPRWAEEGAKPVE